MLYKIKKELLNKKGMSTIEFAISLMIFIFIFSFIFDLCLITYNQYAVSEQTTQMARQIAKQSGLESATPQYFPGGNNNYYTSSEIYDIMKRKMNNLNVSEDDWNIAIKYEDKSNASQIQIKQFNLTSENLNNFNVRTNYGDFITIEVTYNYTWGLWSQFIPNIVKGTTVVERSAFSEYNHNLS